jgi:hypothetical protein
MQPRKMMHTLLYYSERGIFFSQSKLPLPNFVSLVEHFSHSQRILNLFFDK